MSTPPLTIAEVEPPSLLEQSERTVTMLEGMRGFSEIAIESKRVELEYEFLQCHSDSQNVQEWRQKKDSYVEQRLAPFRDTFQTHDALEELTGAQTAFEEAKNALDEASSRLEDAIRLASERMEAVSEMSKRSRPS